MVVQVQQNEDNDAQEKSKVLSKDKIHLTNLEINVVDSMQENKNEGLK